jgi:hypothetical protein
VENLDRALFLDRKIKRIRQEHVMSIRAGAIGRTQRTNLDRGLAAMQKLLAQIFHFAISEHHAL